MPLTTKGEEIKRAMEKEYGGKKEGERVFYASRNKGTISGVDAAPYQPVSPGVTIADIQAKADALWRGQTGPASPPQPPRPGVPVYGDESFEKLEGELAHKKGVEDPQALAAWIGRKNGKIK